MFGQWFGTVSGDADGIAFLSIDKSQSGRLGSIIVDDKKKDSFPFVAAITFEKRNEGNWVGRLNDFIYYSNEQPINRDLLRMTGNVFSSTGEVNVKSQNEGFEGTWSTDKNFKGTLSLKKLSNKPAKEVKKIISWKEFRVLISERENFPEGAYFRGHSSSSYPLRTRFHRAHAWDLYRYAKTVLPELFNYLGAFNNTRYRVNDEEDFGAALYLAQHHGFPTPLLDWSVSPYVASYFAFQPCEESRDSVRVHVFDANKWVKEKAVFAKGGVLAPHFVTRPLLLPIAGNKRAIAQDARSVFYNVDCFNDLEMFDTCITYYDIDAKDSEEALAQLRLMGIHRLKLFPDIDNACDELKRRYF